VAEVRESVSMAMLTLLDQLTPDQRVVFVLRECYDVPYEEIAVLVEKLPAACRQIHRRAALRMESAPITTETSGATHGTLVPSLMRALETGDVATLVHLLRHDAVWISDAGPDRLAARNPVHGADRISRGLVGVVERFIKHHHMVLTMADVNGAPSILVWEDGRLSTVIQIAAEGSQITNLWFSRNPHKLSHLARNLIPELREYQQ
jgi:RNA polymerase sigma-70 factor (ECF subfamily)